MHVFEWWGGERRPLEELIAEIILQYRFMIGYGK